MLVYGGCHALILHNYLQAAFGDIVKSFLLINFEIIRTGQPFPYDDIKNYDVVVYSPIENKGDHNTIHLEQRCQSAGVDLICFPWIEWHGYCPGATKGVFKERFQWYYPDLLDKAAAFDGPFDAFCRDAIESFPNDDVIDRVLAESTWRLKAAETRHDMPVRIADYIENEFSGSRLFLISDHPSRTLYLNLLGQILALLGIAPRTVAARFASLPATEPQWRWRTPIFPKVARRLRLSFEDTNWFDDDIVPGREVDLTTYLGFYFHAPSVIMGPVGDAPIYVRSPDLRAEPLAAGTRLLACQLAQTEPHDRDTYTLLQTLSETTSPIAPGQRFEINPHQWRMSWAS